MKLLNNEGVAMNYPLYLSTLILLLSLNAASFALAAEQDQDKETEKPASTVVLYFENDLFYDSDQYYTNAVKFRVISPPLKTFAKSGMLPGSFDGLMERIERLQHRNTVQYNISAGAGQSIYTPDDTQTSELQKDDRPYAGFLYGFFALHATQAQMMDTFELTVGVVGPSALGEPAQNEVHRMRGINTAKGWENQLHDEPVLMLSWGRNYRLNPHSAWSGWNWDILPYHTVTAGNALTQATVGTEARLGWNLPPSFGTSQIRPGSSVRAPNPDNAVEQTPKSWGFYFFAGAEGRAVANNIFLDGNTWRDSHSVTKEPFVGELNYGAAVTISTVQIAYQHVYLTDEFKKQDGGQNYGAVTLTVPF